MIINSNNTLQCQILTNKCFYRITADLMRSFEEKGYSNAADETANAITAYHNFIQKKQKNTGKDYAEAFSIIDSALHSLANTVFYTHDKNSFEVAYRSFQDFDYINAIIGRQRMKKTSY